MIFLLTEITAKAPAANMPDDLCHVIFAKIARRCSKLGPDTLVFVQDQALMVCQAVKAEQESRWEAIQSADADRPTTIERRSFDLDTVLSLQRSTPYLDSVLQHDEDMLQTQSDFNPHCQACLGSIRGLPTLNLLKDSTEESIYVLAEFETWVAGSLPAWKEQRLSSPASKLVEDCVALAPLAVNYREKALPIYDQVPEQMSTYLLVIAELWHALDLLACKVLPLLKDFAPGILPEFFTPLLLPKQCQMRRIREVELHLADRRKSSNRKNPLLFSDPGNMAFAVQYYASSTEHHALRKRIEDDATAQKANKKKEWEESSAKYHRLKDRAKPRSCDTILDEWDDRTCVHSPSCKKCALDGEADAVPIEVYEWPLPEDESACASTVVELDCPLELVAWRNLTWMLVHDLGRQGGDYGDSSAAVLQRYDALRYYAKNKGSRLTLASTTKPFAKAHYRVLKVPTPLDSCYANNALQYQFFDPTRTCWIKDQTKLPSLRTWCITPLPEGPYASLQYAVDSVGHSQNQVIVDQEACSKALSLHEFLSFGSLRADGERVQWHNIKRELSAFNLSLNTEAVCTLFTQAAWQAGSRPDSVLRNSHLDLSDPAFCEELLAAVVRVFNSIKANWKSDHAILTLIVVVLRTLSLCLEQSILDTALGLLQTIRTAVLQWTETLASMLHQAVDPCQISKTQQRLLKAAILCKMTYDVDVTYLPRVMSTTDDLHVWVICCMHVRENCPGDETVLPSDIGRLIMRDRKVSHTFHRIVRRLITNDSSDGLDRAVARVWAGFQLARCHWTTLDYTNNRWLRTETASSSERRSQEVLYNVFEGELLVDGKPLGRLPTSYTGSDLHRKTFGAQILRVFMSNTPGMLYMSAQELNGYVVYFGMRGEDVIVRIRKGAQTLELIPAHIFDGDLPSAFINKYFHWLDLATREIEFRPLDRRWEYDQENWRLQYQTRHKSCLRNGNRKLVDMRSAACKAVMDVFRALETSGNVHVAYSEDCRLEVSLPRYDLRFYLNEEGKLECYEFGKIVDPDQSLGTRSCVFKRRIKRDAKF